MSELTDLEICTRIAEIEGLNDFTYFEDVNGERQLSVNKNHFNPLTDKALCFDLMVKHEMEFFRYAKTWNCSWYGEHPSIQDKNPQRAICLAIIAKHEGK
jgi:hypothetical protein